MKTTKILCMCAALLSLLTLTSCNKVAEELLDIVGANKFKETDTLLQQDGDTPRNVLSATINGEPGDKIQLYIGNISTKQASSYSKAKWASDETTVATVSPATGNSTIVTLQAIGVAMISVTDSEGNMLTTTVLCEEASDDGTDDGSDDGSSEGTDDENRFASGTCIVNEATGQPIDHLSVMVGENLSFYLALQDSPSEPCGYEFAQWSIDDESVATLSATEGNSVMLEIAGEGTAVVQAADEYGNTLSVVLNAQRPRELFTENITVFWRSSDGSIVDTDENRISCSPDEQIELFVGYIDTQEPCGFEHVRWSQSTNSNDFASLSATTGNETTVSFTGNGSMVVYVYDEQNLSRSVYIDCFGTGGGGGSGDDTDADLDVFDSNDAILDAFDNKVVSGTTVTEYVGNYIDVFIGDQTTKQPDYLRNITWTSSDTNVASFSNDNGYKIRVEIDAQGTSEITATDEKGNALTFTVKGVNSGDMSGAPLRKK